MCIIYRLIYYKVKRDYFYQNPEHKFLGSVKNKIMNEVTRLKQLYYETNGSPLSLNIRNFVINNNTLVTNLYVIRKKGRLTNILQKYRDNQLPEEEYLKKCDVKDKIIKKKNRKKDKIINEEKNIIDNKPLDTRIDIMNPLRF